MLIHRAEVARDGVAVVAVRGAHGPVGGVVTGGEGSRLGAGLVWVPFPFGVGLKVGLRRVGMQHGASSSMPTWGQQSR